MWRMSFCLGLVCCIFFLYFGNLVASPRFCKWNKFALSRQRKICNIADRVGTFLRRRMLSLDVLAYPDHDIAILPSFEKLRLKLKVFRSSSLRIYTRHQGRDIRLQNIREKIIRQWLLIMIWYSRNCFTIPLHPDPQGQYVSCSLNFFVQYPSQATVLHFDMQSIILEFAFLLHDL